MKKRLLSVLMVLCMVLTLLPVSAFAVSNSTVLLHPASNHTVTGVKVQVGDRIDGHEISSISGYDITVDLGEYNVYNDSFRLPYARDIWYGVDDNPVDYISWAGGGNNHRSEGSSALLVNGGNSAYYYFEGEASYPTFTLRYDANGGTGAPATQTYTATSAYELSHTFTISNVEPTRENYTFLGWAESASASSPTRHPGSSIYVNGTTTLYAVWQSNTQSAPSIGNFTKERVTTPPGEGTITLPEGVTVNYSDPVVIPNGGSVTLLYALTVTGGAGANFTITDENATLVGSNCGAKQDSAGAVITGTIPEGATTATIYVIRTFNGDDIVDDKLTNTATIAPGDSTDLGEDVGSATDGGTDASEAAPTITGFTKERVTTPPVGGKIGDVKLNSFDETVDYSTPVTIPANGEVTLMYKLTVTGDANAFFKITDPDATLVGSNNSISQGGDGTITGSIPESGTAVMYVIKTFTADDIDQETGKLTNTATIEAGDGSDLDEGLDDDDGTVNDKYTTPEVGTDASKEDPEDPVTVTKTLTSVVRDGTPLDAEEVNSDTVLYEDDEVTWTIQITNNTDSEVTYRVTDKLSYGGEQAGTATMTLNGAVINDDSTTGTVIIPANDAVEITATYTVDPSTAAGEGTNLTNSVEIRDGEGASESVLASASATNPVGYTIKVTYNGNGGKADGAETKTEVVRSETDPVFTRVEYTVANNDLGFDYTGYRWDGWYTAATGGDAVTGEERDLHGDEIYYAHWKQNVEPADPMDSITVTKEAVIPGGKETAEVGDTLEYTITITNSGDEAATVTVKDIMWGKSGDTVLVNNTPPYVDVSSGSCTVTVAAGDNVTIYYTYRVQESDVGDDVSNTVTVSMPDVSDTTKTDTENVPVEDPEEPDPEPGDITPAIIEGLLKYDVVCTTNPAHNVDQGALQSGTYDYEVSKDDNTCEVKISDVDAYILANHELDKAQMQYDSITLIWNDTQWVTNGTNDTFKFYVKCQEEQPPVVEDTYIITATAGSNGTVDPSGETPVKKGNNLTISITPNQSYAVDTIRVDGIRYVNNGHGMLGVWDKFTFASVNADHDLYVTFAEDQNGNGIPDKYEDPEWPDWPDWPDRPEWPDDPDDGDEDDRDDASDPTYAVYYYPGYGSGARDLDKRYEEDMEVEVLAFEDVDLTGREGYTFIGWSTQPNAGSVTYLPGDTFDMPDHDVYLYAQWLRDQIGPEDTGVANWLNTTDHIAYLTGYPNGAFGPNNSMTRAEVAQMFYALLNNKNVTITATFPDVPADAWYATAVNTLASLGMVSGDADGSFRPNDPITRAEFCVIALAFAYEPERYSCSFTDVSVNDWFYSYVAQAASYGWIGGYADGSFGPNDLITRAQVTTIVNNMLGREADRSYVNNHADTLVQFNDLTSIHWAYYDIMEAVNEHEYTRTYGVEDWVE